MHEINTLRKVFEDAGGRLQAKTLNQLISTREKGGYINNIHENAWDEADKLVWRFRNGQ